MDGLRARLREIFNNDYETQKSEFIKSTDAGICPHCGKKMLKHITHEGARYHVHSYNSYRDKSRHSVRCSDPDCEDNHGVGCCVDHDGNPYN